MTDQPARGPGPADWAIAGLVLILAPALFLLGSRGMGLWEPWETALATLGWQTATETDASIFVPVLDGSPIARSWLQTALLTLGFQLGDGSELGLRTPLAVFNSFGIAAIFVLLRLHFDRVRSLFATLLFVGTPGFALSSMTLAGGGHFLTPASLTLVLLGSAIASPAHRRLLLPMAGLTAGLSFWAAGLLGLLIPLLSLALLACAVRDATAAPSARVAVAAGVAAAIGVVVMAVAGLGIAGTGLVEPGTGLTAAYGASWVAWGPTAAAFVILAVPAALLAGALPGSGIRSAFGGGAGLAGIGVLALVAGIGLLGFRGALSAHPDLTGTDAIAMLLRMDALTGRVLPAHTTFDIVIRLTAFAAYPMVTLAPLGFGWLLRSAESDWSETLDTDAGVRNLKRFVAIWMAVAFVCFGLLASHHHDLVYATVLPVALAVGLALGDTAFLKALYRNRTAWYVIGLASLLLLAMLSKDVRGTYNPEMGRPGPQVIFELLLLDGQVDFPTIYQFGDIKIFFAIWVLLIALFFGRPIEALANLSAWFADAPDAVRGVLPRWLHRPAVAFGAFAARVVLAAHRVLAAAFDRLWHGRNVWMPASAALTGAFAVWGIQLAATDVPAMTHHFSQRGILETFERFAPPETPLYSVGVSRSDATYYLREGMVERRGSISELRTLFCEEGRAFAVIPADEIGQAYYHARRTIERGADEADDACPPQQLYVLDARSSRYLLVSDQLDEAAGETQQSYIAQHVFSEETLPATVRRPETRYVVDGKIELVAYEITPETIDRGKVTINTYWRVIETPRSGYKAFIHVDFRGNRINGDHDLVGGRFPMQYWIPGEIVRDSYDIEVGRADRAGDYRVLFGFFRGDDRLRVEPAIGDNRIPVGDLEVRR